MATKQKRPVRKGSKRKTQKAHKNSKKSKKTTNSLITQKGGSPASNALMNFVNNSGPTINDYTTGMELPSMDNITTFRTQQMGGSLVSDAVMSAQPSMNDYQSHANLPSISQLGGTCGSVTPNNLLHENTETQKGGSPASSRIDSLTQPYTPSAKMNELKGDVITSDMINPNELPNTYQLTGGKRKHKTHKRSRTVKRKHKKSKNTKSSKTTRRTHRSRK